MTEYDESNMSEAARRAYEYARRAFESAPSTPAHAWRGTLEARERARANEGASEESDETPNEISGETANEAANETPGTTAIEEREEARENPPESPAKRSSESHGDSIAVPRATLRERIDAARAENEDDDGYDPWSDRREEPAFFERDPWR